MKIIDVHAHVYPPKIESKAVEAIRAFYGRPQMCHSGSTAELVRSGTHAGLTKYVIFSTATVPHQVEAINDFIIGECAANADFVGVGTLHADYADYARELERIYDAGMHGIKFHPDFQRFNIDDPRLFPMFDILQTKGMFFITHSGDPRYQFSRPERVAHVAREFPRLKIIAAHFGGWSMWELAREVLSHLPNVYYDTSSTFGFGGAEPVRKGFETFDNTHIFFGCDFPMWDHAEELRRLSSVIGEGRLLEDVCWNNFSNFYGGL